MNIPEILAIAVGLSMDAMSVAIATTLTLGKVNSWQIIRFTLSFGFFQAIMPIIGWLAGQGIEKFISTWDHWVAFLLLSAIGIKSILETLKNKNNEPPISDPTLGVSLFLLSIATSIDALAVGLNFGILQVKIWTPAILIGATTSILVASGMLLARFIGARARKSLQIAGGVILVIIGVKILIDHFS